MVKPGLHLHKASQGGAFVLMWTCLRDETTASCLAQMPSLDLPQAMPLVDVDTA